MDFRVQTRSQLAAVAGLRWRMFLNSLRTTRGKLELFSRVVVSVAFAVGGLGGAAGLGAGAYYFVATDKAEYLALLLWPILFFWQAFPIMATAFTNNPDSSDLLRFPLSYRSYFLIRLAYGSLDPATALGCLWLSGILLGISFARPALLPWALVVLLAFAAFNLLLLQMVFAWVERWLAQRRTREIMGVFFILLMLSFQLIGPAMEHFGKRSRPEFQKLVQILAPVQAVLPPGLASDAIAQATRGHFIVGLSSFVLLCALAMALAYLLHLRLRAQFLGENLSEAGPRGVRQKSQSLRLGWSLPGFSPPVAAVFEKEVRYLGRSGPMLLTLIMPIFMLLIFRLGPMNPARHAGFLKNSPEMSFPAAAGYALLILTNLVYNNFGGDGGGIQFFYASPVRFRQIVLAKNLTHACVVAANTALAWLTVSYLYGRPSVAVTGATIAALLFAAPVNFTVGNVLSIYSPKRLNFAAFGRQTASQLTVLVSLGVQIVIGGLVVATFWFARLHDDFWLAAGFFLVLAGITSSVYAVVLRRMDSIAEARRDTLVSELCRA